MAKYRRNFVLMLGILFSAATLLTTPAIADVNVMFIVDASGSMKKAVDNEPRMTAAKRVLGEALGNMPADVRLGLLVYGHRKAKDCTDMELVDPMGSEDAATLAKHISSLKPKGETPIAAALEMAAKSFMAFKGQANSIILVTDGIEECKGDPCAAAQAIKDAGLDLKVDIVGFTLKPEQRKLIECVTDLTGGTYYDANNAQGLTDALAAVSYALANPKDPSLLSVENGGQLIGAPNAQWLKTNDGKLTTHPGGSNWMMAGQAGIYAFKDNLPATFDTFTVLVNETSGENLKDFELLVADDGPGGPFRSIGTFSTQNLKLLTTPNQEFKFTPVTARYLMVKLISNHAGDSYIMPSEFRVLGELQESASTQQSAAPEIPSGAINLLDKANGGIVVGVPAKIWLLETDGILKTYPGGSNWLRRGEEGIYAFKDEKPATFDTFTVLINEADKENLKDFELFVSEEAPGGPYRSIGKFTTANLKLVATPSQIFKFDPVTARYLKVKVLSNHGTDSYIMPSEFQLFGTYASEQLTAPAPAATPVTTPEPAPAPAETAPATTVAAATPAPPAAGTINLLDVSSGGTLLAAGSDGWVANNDGNLTTISNSSNWLRAGEEGIYAFKDGKAASFDTFTVLVTGTSEDNLKEFELFVGDDGPGGAFRSIGKFTTQNIKLLASPSQLFKFDPVTAHFFKVKLLSSHGGASYIMPGEFGLLGTLGSS